MVVGGNVDKSCKCFAISGVPSYPLYPLYSLSDLGPPILFEAPVDSCAVLIQRHVTLNDLRGEMSQLAFFVFSWNLRIFLSVDSPSTLSMHSCAEYGFVVTHPGTRGTAYCQC